MSKLYRVTTGLGLAVLPGTVLMMARPVRADTFLTVPPVSIPPVPVPQVTVPSPPPLPGSPPSTPSGLAPANAAPPQSVLARGIASAPAASSPSAPTATPTPAPRPPRLAPVARDLPAVNVVTPLAPPLRQAVADSARHFAFPLTLAAMVLVFLLIQHRIGAGDPRLVAAPVDDDRRAFR